MTPLDYFFRDIKLGFLYLLFGAGAPLGFTLLWLWIMRDSHSGVIVWLPTVAAVAAIALVWYFTRRKPIPAEEELKKKLKGRLQAGEVLASQTTVRLTEEDIQAIKTLNRNLILLLIPTMGVVLFVVYEAAITLTSYAMIITPAAALLLAFLIYKYSQILGRVIEKGEKRVVKGFITDKYTRNLVRTKHYYVVLGEIEVEISMFRYPYLACQIGDLLEVESLPDFGNYVLRRKTITS